MQIHYVIVFDSVGENESKTKNILLDKASKVLRTDRNDFTELELKEASVYIKDQERRRSSWTGRVIQPKLSNVVKYY